MLNNLTLRTKALIGIAIACAGYVVFAPASEQTIEPTRDTGASVTRRAATAPAAKRLPVMNASLRFSDRIVEDKTAASLFSAHSWYVAPPPPLPAPVVHVAPPPPTAPPLPFAFMGSYKSEGGSVYYLTSGDRVYDVKIGDTLNSTYTVDGVKSGQLLLTYMPLKIQQSLAVGDE